MKDKILNNWTFTRVLYLAMGTFVMVQSAIDRLWLGVIIGIYFASMGIFALGCAAGNCSVPKVQSTTSKKNDEIAFEETK
jgi:hypothetical protein